MTKLRRFVPLLMLVAVIGLIVALFVYRDVVAQFESLGYLGAFLIGLVTNATVILPVPGIILLFALGATFNPILVGVTGAAGGTIGELSGYLMGYGGHGFVSNNKVYRWANRWMKRWGSATIFVFALVPFLPLDVAGIIAGTLRFPVWKFLLLCFLGKALLYSSLTLATAWGWQTIPGWFA